MAEIKIEKKKPVWPWILLGLLILAVILYFVFANNDTRDDLDDTDDREQVRDTTYTNNQRTDNTTRWEDNTATTIQGGEVENYISHVNDKSRMGVDHEYTNNALIHLINAVETKAREVNVDVDVAIQEMRNESREITQNPQGTNHANKIKNVGAKIAGTLEDIQEEKFPNLSDEVEEVKTAVRDIDATTLTLDQKDKINIFFNHAADVLKKMS